MPSAGASPPTSSGCATPRRRRRLGPAGRRVRRTGPAHGRPLLLPEGRRGTAPLARPPAGRQRRRAHRPRGPRQRPSPLRRRPGLRRPGDRGVPRHWPAHAVLADARTQLGDEPGATEAAQQLLDLRPGTAAFTRAAYDLEQHGRTDDARTALQRALDDAFDPADKAFCRYQIAELDRSNGHPDQALTGYRQALADDPSYTPALAGRARAEAALGDPDGAVRDYTTAIDRVPLPQYLLELGELQESLRHPTEAREQYRLLAAEQQLAAANGVVDDLTIGQYQADHGDPDQAVTLLRAEWQRRHNVLVADALAWALHRQGNDREALPLAEQAQRHGWHNALFAHHRGEIERALGLTDAAREHLAEALRTDPFFSPLLAPQARTALAALGGTP